MQCNKTENVREDEETMRCIQSDCYHNQNKSLADLSREWICKTEALIKLKRSYSLQ